MKAPFIIEIEDCGQAEAQARALREVRYAWGQVGSTRRGHLFLVLPGRLAEVSACGNVKPPIAHMPMTQNTVRCAACRRLGRKFIDMATP